MTSTIKVNNVQNQCGQNIINENSNTITIGASGDTIALASGASQTGFGRTGTVDWQTSIKTSTITAVNGEGYFVNTTGGAITANLPAGVVGAIVSFKDYAGTFQTHNLTIAANGSEKIEGQTFDLVLETQGAAVTLVYGDATKGWQAVNSNEISNQLKYVAATGGTITTVCTNFKVHTFTGPGTFEVTCAGSLGGSNTVDYLVVAGGGGGGDGGDRGGGGGGAGGYRESPGTASGSYTVSPLGVSPAVALPVTATGFPITVGGGGCGTSTNPQNAGNGSNSIFSSITAIGGGGGGACCTSSPRGRDGAPGGSGGAAGASGSVGTSGTGNTPPVTPPQGNDAGDAFDGGGNNSSGGGGGGALAVGVNAASGSAGNGGGGATSSINGTPTARAGGGGGAGGSPVTAGNGGSGGGGNGNNWPGGPGGGTGGNGTVNTGGGGGGAGTNCGGGNGGSGVVIIRYKFQ